MFIDWTYIYLVLPAVIFAMWASAKVNSAFQRYSKVYSRNNITGRVSRADGAAGKWRFWGAD